MKIYQYDALGFPTGNSEERDTQLLGIPPRYTPIAPPILEDGEYTQWDGDGWALLDQDPLADQKAEQVLEAKEQYLDEVRELREKLLNRIDGIAFRAQIAGDNITVQSYLTATQRLLDITKLPAVLAATSREEAEVAVKAEYASIVVSVKSLAPTLVSAFYEVAK